MIVKESRDFQDTYKTSNGEIVTLDYLIKAYVYFIKKCLLQDVDTWSDYSFSQFIEDSSDHVITGIDLDE